MQAHVESAASFIDFTHTLRNVASEVLHHELTACLARASCFVATAVGHDRSVYTVVSPGAASRRFLASAIGFLGGWASKYG